MRKSVSAHQGEQVGSQQALSKHVSSGSSTEFTAQPATVLLTWWCLGWDCVHLTFPAECAGQSLTTQPHSVSLQIVDKMLAQARQSSYFGNQALLAEHCVTGTYDAVLTQQNVFQLQVSVHNLQQQPQPEKHARAATCLEDVPS